MRMRHRIRKGEEKAKQNWEETRDRHLIGFFFFNSEPVCVLWVCVRVAVEKRRGAEVFSAIKIAAESHLPRQLDYKKRAKMK